MAKDAPIDERPERPDTYDDAYPGRFLKAGNLHGKRTTFTILDVERRSLRGENGPERRTTLTLGRKENGKPKEYQIVCPKLNGQCLRAMFGTTIAEWIGKRVTLFPTNKYAPMNGEECIRVWGSTDIKADIDVTIELPRRKPFTMTMHAVETATGAKPAAATPEHDAEPPREPGDDA
jgi:hypothetical protein